MYTHLTTLHDPNDLKAFNIEQLEELAEEIRHFILEHVSNTGGHLASNLGVVELTLAIHYVFASPKDYIIWDVGHQSYIHKILTNRWERFGTLRQYGGLSGFPKRSESDHDKFETGHSSTSISAALGIARARDIKGDKHHVLAVIGDGAIGSGMAFEALNDVGHTNTNLIVILNDNEMSISRNVGALSNHLSKLRINSRYRWIKRELEQLLKKIPLVGKGLYNFAERLKNSMKYFMVHGILFEELGFTYVGPIDGHNMGQLVAMLKRAKTIEGPVLIHVITQKGRGYSLAEKNPEHYHGVSPFDIDNGYENNNSNKTYSSVFGQHLVDLAKHDNDIVAITAAMPEGTGLLPFRKHYPERFFDVGIAEQHAVTLAAGMACKGLKPVVAIYSTFIQRAFDQIIHDVCMQNLNVVFAIDRAGLVGEDGETHQGVFDISFLRLMPNLTIMAPKNTQELKSMIDYALKIDGPVAIRYPRGSRGSETMPMEDQESLKWELISEGSDIALIAVGPFVDTAEKAADKLKDYGINAAVVNARILKPLDSDFMKDLAENTKYWFTIEDNVVAGGFGTAVNDYVSENLPHINVTNIGVPDRFIPHGSIDVLYKMLGLDTEGIVKRVTDEMSVRRKEACGITAEREN